MDKAIVYTIIIIIIAGVVFWGFQSGFLGNIFSGPVTNIPVPDGILLFFGADCPHCKLVEDFIKANSIDQKVVFDNLEVPFNGKTSQQLQDNAALAIQLAKGCKLNVINGISIPFLYDGKGQCILGDEPVINFFKNAAGIK